MNGGLILSTAIMLAGGAMATLWSARVAIRGNHGWRLPQAAAAVLLPLGFLALWRAIPWLGVLSGLALTMIALALLGGYRGEGRLYAAVHLVLGLVLASGAPVLPFAVLAPEGP